MKEVVDQHHSNEGAIIARLENLKHLIKDNANSIEAEGIVRHGGICGLMSDLGILQDKMAAIQAFHETSIGINCLTKRFEPADGVYLSKRSLTPDEVSSHITDLMKKNAVNQSRKSELSRLK